MDKSLEYNSLINKVKMMISNVNKMGINTDKFNETLNNIIHNVENRNINSTKQDMASAFLTMDYTYGISELMRLEVILDKYNVYFKAINTCYYLDSQLSKTSDDELIKKYAHQMIMTLKSIRSSGNIHYEDKTKVLNKIYDTVYKLLKLEIANFNESYVYNYVKDNDDDLYILNNYVVKDIEKLDLNDGKYSGLKERMHEINSLGLDKSYFDLKIIKLLLYFEDKLELDNSIEDTLSKLEENTKVISSKVTRLSSQKDKVNELKHDLNKLKLFFTTRCVSLLVALSIVITGGVGIFKLSKAIATSKNYKMVTTTYSDKWGLNTEEGLIEDFVASKYADNSVFINVYDVWHETLDGYARDYKQYDVSSYQFDDIKNYLDYSLDYYDVDYIENKESQYSVTDLYKSEYAEVMKLDIDKSEVIKEIDKSEFGISLTGFYIIYIFVLVLICCKINSDTFFFDDLKENFEKYDDKKWNKKEELAKLKKMIEEISNIVNSNDELRKQFETLYEENKYLLNKPEELYNRFNELVKEVNINDVKKLIKEKA